tara:strand:- start:162 stop:365 length:204 start_codon:yes stop_codon:yes gene_type:complete
MGSKPEPYKPSAEELALRTAQLEELRTKKSEIAEAKVRAAKGAKAGRSLITEPYNPSAAEPLDTLGA